jgi:hypothetical protein
VVAAKAFVHKWISHNNCETEYEYSKDQSEDKIKTLLLQDVIPIFKILQ